MDLYRFYVPELLAGPADEEIQLPESEGHHARSVLRLEAGEVVALFDGMGGSVPGKIVRVGKPGVWVLRQGVPVTEGPPVPALTIATAIPKGERAEWLVEQASQLNVTAVQFLECDRSVVKLRDEGHKLDKWKRLAIESAKQCGRAHLLEIREPLKIAAVREPAAGTCRVLWLDPRPGGATVQQALEGWNGAVLGLIGPEGGWSDGERKILESAVANGWVQRVRLTPTVLRIETACTALAAAVMCR